MRAKVLISGQHLQAQLRNELTAINQYFLHYRILKHWGLGKLAKKEYEESLGEMKHADRLMDRILGNRLTTKRGATDGTHCYEARALAESGLH